MIRKVLSLSILVTVFIAAWFLVFGETTLALAQEDSPPKDASCVVCHENLYLLHDSGKWYCLCKSPVLCTDCHGGRTDTMIEDIAHEGMVANPIANNASFCRDCHPDDYQARVDKFASIAGVGSTPHPCPTYQPVAQILQPPEGGGEAKWLRALPSGLWQAVGTGFLGIALLALFVFACRCWRIDQLSNIKRE